jgi:CheY-like chemotaxis protein/anti-sigma regulatory factor (Ser/Thr protein kinase)
MRADQAKVRQALFNLLSNAAKFTHDGTVTLDALRERMDDSEWIVFRVVDTGIGVTSEKLLRLFQDFTQADASTTRKFGGTGLGLALTRRFCQMMGGDVTVSSEDGAGSTFTIKLPAIVSDPETSESEEQPGEDNRITSVDRREGDPAPAPGTCVLVIDDNASQRDLMRRYLVNEGYCVRCAGSGEEGLRLAREMRPIAITLDVMMPEMDGWEVLKALQADRDLSDIPVIMLTVVDDPDRGMRYGATEYLTKPVNRQRLSTILKRYRCAAAPCPVLVVEHDEVIRRSMRRLLGRNGCRVTEAVDGAAALTLMETDRPTLIFLDLFIEGMDGFAFVEQVRKHPEWRSIPIIVVTAHDLTSAERKRLNGNVETILQEAGQSRNEVLAQVIDALDNSAVSRLATV